MVTILRFQGLAVRIYKDDHPPAHVHVVGDGIAKIDPGPPDGPPTFVWPRGMTPREERRAWDLVVRNRDLLLARWSEIHDA